MITYLDLPTYVIFTQFRGSDMVAVVNFTSNVVLNGYTHTHTHTHVASCLVGHGTLTKVKSLPATEHHIVLVLTSLTLVTHRPLSANCNHI